MSQVISRLPTRIYLLKVMSAKLTIKTPDFLTFWLSRVFAVNFEHISHLVLVFPPLTLTEFRRMKELSNSW